jgi:hypothetical protein
MARLGVSTIARMFRRAAGLALLAISTACSMTPDGPPLPCPQVLTVGEAGRMTKFAGESEDLSESVFEAKVDAIQSQCFYAENRIRTEMRVQFLATRGPMDRDGLAPFNYFVAITGPGGTRIAREIFDAQIEFSGDKVQSFVVEELEPTIYLKSGENGDFYRIYVGFMLSEKELAYNHRNPR